MDKPRDHCGLFGVFNHPDAARLTYFGLHALQHRGQESAGIATSVRDEARGRQTMPVHKDFGLVLDVFDDEALFEQTLLGGLSGLGSPIGELTRGLWEFDAVINNLGASMPDGAPATKKVSASDTYGKQIAELVKKVGIGPDTAAQIGKFAGKGLAGAFEGQAAAGVASLLGIKTSGTGSAVGGALGGLTGIPGARAMK